jgi:ribose/xylose/arabinose/galactoside ABC-type transport system permease subunit
MTPSADTETREPATSPARPPAQRDDLPSARPAEPGSGLAGLWAAADGQRIGLAGALVVLCVVASVLSPVFFTSGNAVNVARAIALIGIVSIGQTVVLLCGGIDLSVGAVAAIAGVVLVKTQGVGLPLAVLLALGAGLAVGAFHGTVVVRTGINSLIVTLATMTALRGLVYVVTNGFPLPLRSESLTTTLWTTVLGIPVPALILAVLLVAGYVMLNWTSFGTAIYATGGNRGAASDAGIRVNRTTVLAFVLSGGLAAVAGVLLAARFGSAAADAGMGWELLSIAAVVIGGTSLAGGRGDLLGTLLGVLLLGVITNAMDLLSINSFYQQIVQGGLILIAVGASTIRERLDRRTLAA